MSETTLTVLITSIASILTALITAGLTAYTQITIERIKNKKNNETTIPEADLKTFNKQPVTVYSVLRNVNWLITIVLTIIAAVIIATVLIFFQPKSISCKNYGITLRTPMPGYVIKPNVEGHLTLDTMEGDYKKEIPDGWELWVFSAFNETHYRPKSRILLNNGMWKNQNALSLGQASTTIGKEDLIIFLVGKDGLTLINYHYYIAEFMKNNPELSDKVSWFPIKDKQSLTKDMSECTSVTVTLSPKL